MFAASRMPSTTRTIICGSLSAANGSARPLGSVGSLKFLTIEHAHLVAIQRIGLRWWDFRRNRGRTEDVGRLHLYEESVELRGLVRAHNHLQIDPVFAVELRPDLEDADIVRNYLLQVGKDACPTDAFAAENVVQKDAVLKYFLV